MTAREALREYIEELSEDEAAHLLDRLRWEALDSSAPLTAAQRAAVERGLADIAAGRVTDHDEVVRRLGLVD
jgi:hypothetical protein